MNDANGRALVVVRADGGNVRPIGGPRVSATFLAQLIATAQRAPQTRERRRATPAEAIVSYRRAQLFGITGKAPRGRGTAA
jgi:hypothetical protein